MKSPDLRLAVRLAFGVAFLLPASCRAPETALAPEPLAGSRTVTAPPYYGPAWRAPHPQAGGGEARPDEIGIPRFAGGRLPVYPDRSVRAHEEGAVLLRFEVRENGSVKDLGVEGSSGFRGLDDAALAAARTWRFSPTTGGGEVDVIRYRLQFRLVDGDAPASR